MIVTAALPAEPLEPPVVRVASIIPLQAVSEDDPSWLPLLWARDLEPELVTYVTTCLTDAVAQGLVETVDDVTLDLYIATCAGFLCDDFLDGG